MTGHLCWPRCAGCVREIARARDAVRAELLPRLERTAPANQNEESPREPAVA